MKKCPECSSEKIIIGAEMREQGEDYASQSPRIVVFQDPKAFIFKKAVYSDIRVDVCGDCGLAQMYARDYRFLWSAYQTSISDVE